MKSWVGRSILVIGMLHTLVGVVAFHEVLFSILREGLFNTIPLNQQPERETAFWFLFTGLSLLIIGGLVVWIERNNMDTPAFLSWSFLSITTVGAIIMPVSGFWLLFIPTIGLFRRRRKSGADRIQ